MAMPRKRKIEQVDLEPKSILAKTPIMQRFNADDEDIEIVDIYVGPERKHFKVHRSKLCKKIEYFHSMLMGNYSEAESLQVEFEDEDPALFNLLVGWVYGGAIQRPEIQAGEAACHPNAFGMTPEKVRVSSQVVKLIKLYIFAAKLFIFDLMDETMDVILAVAPKDWSLPVCPVGTTRFIYEHTSADSKLRLWLARTMYFYMGPNQPVTTDAEADIEGRRIAETLSESLTLSAAVMSLSIVRKLTCPKAATDYTRTYKWCDYHLHPKGHENCVGFLQAERTKRQSISAKKGRKARAENAAASASKMIGNSPALSEEEEEEDFLPPARPIYRDQESQPSQRRQQRQPGQHRQPSQHHQHRQHREPVAAGRPRLQIGAPTTAGLSPHPGVSRFDIASRHRVSVAPSDSYSSCGPRDPDRPVSKKRKTNR